MQSIYFVDPSFTYESSKQSILSIRYATDGFSFCVHNASDKLVVFMHEPHTVDSKDAAIARLKNNLVNDAILNLRFKRVYLMSCLKEKILIPSAFFDKANLPTLYSINQEFASNEVLLYHHIDAMDAYITEAITACFNDFIREHFPVVQIVNETYPFIQGALSKALHDTEQMFMNIHDGYFDLLFIRDTRVQLFNTFNYRTETDIVYFLLNCIQECNLNKEKIHLSILGRMSDENKLNKLLSTYLPNLYFAKEPLLSGILNDKNDSGSCFIHLLNIHRCGL